MTSSSLSGKKKRTTWLKDELAGRNNTMRSAGRPTSGQRQKEENRRWWNGMNPREQTSAKPHIEYTTRTRGRLIALSRDLEQAVHGVYEQCPGRELERSSLPPTAILPKTPVDPQTYPIPPPRPGAAFPSLLVGFPVSLSKLPSYGRALMRSHQIPSLPGGRRESTGPALRKHFILFPSSPSH